MNCLSSQNQYIKTTWFSLYVSRKPPWVTMFPPFLQKMASFVPHLSTSTRSSSQEDRSIRYRVITPTSSTSATIPITSTSSTTTILHPANRTNFKGHFETWGFFVFFFGKIIARLLKCLIIIDLFWKLWNSVVLSFNKFMKFWDPLLPCLLFLSHYDYSIALVLCCNSPIRKSEARWNRHREVYVGWADCF